MALIFLVPDHGCADLDLLFNDDAGPLEVFLAAGRYKVVSVQHHVGLMLMMSEDANVCSGHFRSGV